MAAKVMSVVAMALLLVNVTAFAAIAVSKEEIMVKNEDHWKQQDDDVIVTKDVHAGEHLRANPSEEVHMISMRGKKLLQIDSRCIDVHCDGLTLDDGRTFDDCPNRDGCTCAKDGIPLPSETINGYYCKWTGISPTDDNTDSGNVDIGVINDFLFESVINYYNHFPGDNNESNDASYDTNDSDDSNTT